MKKSLHKTTGKRKAKKVSKTRLKYPVKKAKRKSKTRIRALEESVTQTASFIPSGVDSKQGIQKEPSYMLPSSYEDNRIVLLPRDPWWLHTYWDIAQSRIEEVISLIPSSDRDNLKWVLRVYDVSGVDRHKVSNANNFFDIDINLAAGNWYINANCPGKEWCVEIGLKSLSGKFFAVLRSNVVKTPGFGISSILDEEWLAMEEEYFKILGVYDLGRSSLERRKRIEKFFIEQISSPLALWGSTQSEQDEIPAVKTPNK